MMGESAEKNLFITMKNHLKNFAEQLAKKYE